MFFNGFYADYFPPSFNCHAIWESCVATVSQVELHLPGHYARFPSRGQSSSTAIAHLIISHYFIDFEV